jgi:hypothetical protein
MKCIKHQTAFPEALPSSTSKIHEITAALVILTVEE